MRTKTYVELMINRDTEMPMLYVYPCDSDRDKAETLVEKHGFEKVVLCFRKVLSWGDLTVITELFPNSHYGQNLLRAKEERELNK